MHELGGAGVVEAEVPGALYWETLNAHFANGHFCF